MVATFSLFTEELVQSQVLDFLAYEKGPSPLGQLGQKIAIACTARSGSTLLCNALENYGVSASEYFNPTEFVTVSKLDHGLSTIRQLGELLVRDHAPGGRFAVKLAFPNLPWLFLLKEFPQNIGLWKFVFLTRLDLVEQAVSGLIAELTGSWSASSAPRRQLTDEDYDYERIRTHMNAYATENGCWEQFFSLFGVKPMRLTYEELAADTPARTRDVAKFLGITDGESGLVQEFLVTLQRQTTDLNRDWVRRTREITYAQATGAD